MPGASSGVAWRIEIVGGAIAAPVSREYSQRAAENGGLLAEGWEAASLVRERISPAVSLYVNEWNVPARRAYERVGFQETTRFATVMF